MSGIPKTRSFRKLHVVVLAKKKKSINKQMSLQLCFNKAGGGGGGWGWNGTRIFRGYPDKKYGIKLLTTNGTNEAVFSPVNLAI